MKDAKPRLPLTINFKLIWMNTRRTTLFQTLALTEILLILRIVTELLEENLSNNVLIQDQLVILIMDA